MIYLAFKGMSLLQLGVLEVIIFVTTSDYINTLIPSKNRATIISFQSMIFSFFMIVIFPLVGKQGNLYSLTFAFIILAALATIFMFVNFYVVATMKKL